jgi:hypothetical protein
MLEIGKPLHIGLAFPLVTFLKLSGKPLLEGVRPCPRRRMLPVDLVPDLYIGQGSKCSLNFIQTVVRIAGGLCQRCKRLLRGRAMGHGALPFQDGSHHSTAASTKKGDFAAQERFAPLQAADVR